MSQQQAAYRSDLIEKVLRPARDHTLGMPPDGPVTLPPVTLRTFDRDLIRTAALALALPEPASSTEASEQIDALMAGGAGLIPYARDHRDWARPVLDALTDAWGRDYSGRPATITPDDLRALSTGGSA